MGDYRIIVDAGHGGLWKIQILRNDYKCKGIQGFKVLMIKYLF